MQQLYFPAIIALFSVLLFSCKKDMTDTKVDEISAATLAKIQAEGYSIKDIQKVDEGYLVEGDIVLTDEYLQNANGWKTYIIAKEEQYHTTNLVVTSGSTRTITVSISGTINQAFSTALDNAIARYDQENLFLNFERVGSGGNIVIKIVNTGQYIASAGFPSNGNPYPEIKYAKKYTNYGNGFMTTVLTHELGHCIGFRHTDYMNRAYSCGSGGNEGQTSTGVGAVHIPGTPTIGDPESWMLACLSASTDRPFNVHDKIALAYVY